MMGIISAHGVGTRVQRTRRNSVTAGPGRRSGARSYAVPFIVAVTGHRDLVADELPVLRSRVRDCLFSLPLRIPQSHHRGVVVAGRWR